jgi:hypothetical protein
MLLGIRPGDDAYIDHTGAVYHAQDENDNDEVAYYEIQATGDTIEFDVRDHSQGLETPTLTLHTQWGETDFNLEDRVDNEVIVAEQSGYDNDIWMVDLSGTSGRLRLTQFDTTNGVDGTKAAWLPFVGLINVET